MTVKQVFYIFLQVLGMLTFVGAGVAGTLVYIGAQKNAAKQGTGIEKPVTLTPVEPFEIEGPAPISQPITNSERLAKVKAKAKSRPAAKPVKPVAYSAPKKPEVKPVEKPTTATKKRVPAAKKPVAPTKAEVRRMAVNSAEPLHYGPSPETKAQVQSILQFRATDNNVPSEVKRAKFNPKIGGAGMSDNEQAAKQQLDAELKKFWATGEMNKK